MSSVQYSSRMVLFVFTDQLPSGFSQALLKDDSKQRQPLSHEELLQRNEVIDRRCHGTEHFGRATTDKVIC